MKGLPCYIEDYLMIFEDSKLNSHLFVLEIRNKTNATFVALVEVSKGR